MVGRWETLILLLCELPAALHVLRLWTNRDRKCRMKKTERGPWVKKKKIILLYAFQIDKPFFKKKKKNGGQENYALVHIKHLHWVPSYYSQRS